MIQLSYVSTATKPMSKQAFETLLEECRHNNSMIGITGMLLYGNKTFIQVLEGPEDAVESIFKKIQQDPRHTDVKVIQKKILQRREYSDWSMAFKQISRDDLQTVEGLNNFTEADLTTDHLGHQAPTVNALMAHFRQETQKYIGQGELSTDDDPIIKFCHQTIRKAVKVLAVLMMITIIWGVIDVMYVMYKTLIMPTFTSLTLIDVVVTFGSFLVVLIAIEIFINITLYIRRDVIHVKLVVATALMAMARKVIILDFNEVSPSYVWATGVVVLALGVTYWLIERRITWGEPDKL
jgi:uncharacterized membrane protein (DUF373 family)